MKSALFKDIFREIGKTKSRFFSIFAIIALGAGFFAGLKVTCPDMLTTLERYFEDKNLMDIRLVSTYGFDDNDVKAIEGTNGVRDVFLSYSKDVFIKNNEGENIIAKVMTFPDKNVNKVGILEGRPPESGDECVTEEGRFEIGDTITVYVTDRKNPLSDSLKRESWKVVGHVMSPQYISSNKGSSTIGDGTMDTFIMVTEENFNMEVYTEVYITLENTAGVGTYDDGYIGFVNEGIEAFEKVASVREKERLTDIQKKAKKELNKAKEEITAAEKELEDAEKELLDAYNKLKKSEKDIAKGWKEYDEGLSKLEEGKESFEIELAKGEAELIDGSNAIKKAEEEYEKGLEQYNEGAKTVKDILEAFGTSSEELQQKKNELLGKIEEVAESEYSEEIIKGYELQIETLDVIFERFIQMDDAKELLEEAKKQIDEGKEQIAYGWKAFEDGREKGKAELEKAEKELEDGKKKLINGEKELADGWEKYNEGKTEFEEKKLSAEDEIDSAKEDIKKAEKEIAGLKRPIWYIFTRDDNSGYSTYKNDVYIIESVGKVFPVFFFLVAMLVCLTTMTRMVEEQRTQVGTMKALGYSNGFIMLKFIVYSAIASLAGAAFGIAFCSFLFPEVIYFAYGMIYILPRLVHVPQVGMWIIVAAVGFCCTAAAVTMACYAELKESPAQLMRPKAPKAGKRVLLEKISFIWKHLSFIYKVTIRNLFRYKKRIFMTVLGIAGCAALTLTGFGLYSSVSVILEKQYSEIFNYDLIVALDTDAGKRPINAVMEELEKNDISRTNLGVYMMAAEYKGIGDISLVVTDNKEELSNLILFRDRKSGKAYELSNDGVIITERFSEIANLSVGDEFAFYCDGILFETKVDAITENYAMHFIYMTDTLYSELSKDDMKANMVFTVMSNTDNESQDKLAQRLMPLEGVLGLSFSKTTMEIFSNTVENLNYVVVLIILCAAALAFVVLYNLTNINITERIREIATIKVLGFYDGEVSSYVFRENVFLSIMGAGAGLILGAWLHTFVLSVIQAQNIMFGKGIPLWAYFAAFAMTMFFSVVVNWIMFYKLKKVSMVESLKSVE